MTVIAARPGTAQTQSWASTIFLLLLLLLLRGGEGGGGSEDGIRQKPLVIPDMTRDLGSRLTCPKANDEAAAYACKIQNYPPMDRV